MSAPGQPSAGRSIRPDFTALEVPVDAWSEPFWQAGAEGRLVMPCCAACGTFRWPAGPFCPDCRAQEVAWVPPGQARIYSFTRIPAPAASPSADQDAPPRWRLPTLVEFDDAPGVRLVSVLVEAPVDGIAIGDPVDVEWQPAANLPVPVFRHRA